MKTLVAYYSFGGNTKAVAEKVARSLRADVIEIKTVKEYPDDYDVLLSLAEKEVSSGYIPALRPVEIEWDKYDAVLLGTPVWWGSITPAMKKFLSNYKWKGRVVYPFVTDDGKIGRVIGDFKKGLRGAFVGPVLNVKFEDNEQVTPDLVLKDWVSIIKDGRIKD
ncbi:MAG: NAD(P)H-dependent oxidoreductase [Clostridia bacterium]|nr:NAD(P)H-dependent oxidoreductase [Clostridia bacterium]